MPATSCNPPSRPKVLAPKPVSLLRATALLLCSAALAGCPAQGDEVRPPRDQIFFPTGMAMAPDESALFVINANSDLRYDSGSISVIDLERVDAIADEWVGSGQAPGGRDCDVDSDIRYTLVCDESEAVRADGAVRIGNFATEVAVQVLGSGALRLFAAVRGDPSITYVDYDADSGTLFCGDEGASFPECDEEHRLVNLMNDPDAGDIPSEPFGLYVDSDAGYVVITHLTRGAVSLADAPTDGSAPQLVDALGNVFLVNPDTGAQGAVGVAGRRPGSASDRVYVTSRSESRVQIFTIPRVGGLPALVPGEFFFLRGVRPSDDSRGIAFGLGGDRAYVINRDPPLLHILDTSLSPEGQPRNELLDGVELCQQASTLAVADTGAGERVYVSCFRDGQIWVIDPAGGVVQSIIDVGRGPQTVVVAEGRQKLYVTNFLEDTIAVVDLEPGSTTENRVVLRLGRPRSLGGD